MIQSKLKKWKHFQDIGCVKYRDLSIFRPENMLMGVISMKIIDSYDLVVLIIDYKKWKINWKCILLNINWS